MTKDKFKTALGMFADLDAIRNSQNMDEVVDFLYEAVTDAKPSLKQAAGGVKEVVHCEEHPKSAYLIMTFYNGQPSTIDRIFDNFALAKEYVVDELGDYVHDLRKDCEYEIADKLEKIREEFRNYIEEESFESNYEWTSKSANSDFYMYMTRVEMNEEVGIDF